MKINLEDGRYIKVDIEKDEKGTYKYYSEGVLLGVFDPEKMKDNKFLEIDLEKNNTISNELSAEIKDDIKQIISQVKDKIEQVDIEVIEEEAEENKALEKYIKAIGKDNNKKSKKVASIDIDDKKDKKEKTDNNIKLKNDEQEKIFTTSDVSIKQEIDLGERANDVQDFKNWIGSNNLPEGSQKVAVIETSELRQMKDENGNAIDNSSTRYGLVLIRKGENGQKVVEPLKKYVPQLEQNHSSGNSPIKEKYQIESDGTVEKDAVTSEYRIANKIIQIDKDQGDNMEVNIGKYSYNSNNTVTTQMRGNQTTFVTDIENRKASQGYYKGTQNPQESYEEAEHKSDEHEDHMKAEDVDGNNETKSDEHISAMAREILDNNSEIPKVYNQADVEKHIREMMNNNKEFSEQEVMEKVTEEMEESAELEHEMEGQENN